MSITSPVDGLILAGPVDVIGTVNSATLRAYTVDASPHGQNNWLTLASGTTSVTNAFLGTVDPTRFAPGTLDLRLQATDTSGQTASTVQQFVTDGVGEVGANAFTLTDLKISLVGVPITILRHYDSFSRIKGDFGANWAMQIENVEKIERANPAGDGWDFSGDCVFQKHLDEQKAHLYVFRVLGRSITYRFAPIFDGCGVGETFYKIHFEPLGNVYGTTISGYGEGSELVLPSASGRMLDTDTNLYDPQTFTLRFANGRAYTLDIQQGLQAVRDSNGSQITITPSGIAHSSGLNVSFARDTAGRITGITRPDAKHRTYTYDAAGDLVAATDFAGGLSQYFYDGDHNLVRIVDPTGKTILAALYGSDGRISAAIDASGNPNSVQYDLANRTETVFDRTGAPTLIAYNLRGLETAKTDAVGRTARHEYDANGKLTAAIDPLGNRTELTYDSLGRQTSIKLPTGLTKTMTYDAASHLTSRTDGLGDTERFTYDVSGNLTTITDRAGQSTDFSYDTKGSLASVRDGSGRAITYQSDAHGFVAGMTDAFGVSHSVAVDPMGNPTSYSATIDGKSVSVSLGYNANGSLTTLQGPLGEISSLGYDEDGRITGGTNPIDGTTNVVHDANGQIAGITIGAGTTTVTRDAVGRVLTEVSPGGRTTSTTRDASGRPVQQQFIDGSQVTSAYASNGLLASETDRLGHVTNFEYDALGRVIAVHDPVGHTKSLAYDALSRITSMTDAAGVQTVYTRNGRGDVTSVSVAGGPAATFTYDPLGQVASYTDPNGNTSSFAYGASGGVSRSTDGAGDVATATYSPSGLTAFTDANNHTQRYNRDSLGNVSNRTLPDGSAESFAFDLAAKTTTRTGFDGQTTVSNYSAQRRVTQIRADDGTTIGFSYNADGLLNGLSDARGMTTLALDGGGHVSTQTEPVGPAVGYSYDGAQRLTSVSVGGDTTTYATDAGGQVTAVTDWSGRRTTMTYDSAGRLAMMSDPNGTVETRTYDTRGRLATVQVVAGAVTVFGESYTYDAAGRLTSAVEAIGRRVDYTYDAADRLTSATVTPVGGGATQVTTYTHDAGGNITQIVSPNDTRSFTYDVNDRVQSDGVATYQYDREGRLTAVVGGPNAATLSYDGLGRLLDVHTTGSALGVHRVMYTYDAQGLMATRTTDGTVRQFVWDRRGMVPQILQELDGAGNVVARNLVAGLVLAREASGTMRYLHHDRLGSVRAVIDGAGTMLGTVDFAAYGELVGGVLNDETGYGFAGERLDPTTGFYFLRARHYAPHLGRFLTPDLGEPDIRVPDTLNRYVYALANPMAFVDPTGLEFELGSVETSIAIEANLFVAENASFLTAASVVSSVLAVCLFNVIWRNSRFDPDPQSDFPNPVADATVYSLQATVGAGPAFGTAGNDLLGWIGSPERNPFRNADYLFEGRGFGGFTVASASQYVGVTYDTPTPQSYVGVFVSLTVPTLLAPIAGGTLGTPAYALAIGGIASIFRRTSIGSRATTSIFMSPVPAMVSDLNGSSATEAQPWGWESGVGVSAPLATTIPSLASIAFTNYTPVWHG